MPKQKMKTEHKILSWFVFVVIVGGILTITGAAQSADVEITPHLYSVDLGTTITFTVTVRNTGDEPFPKGTKLDFGYRYMSLQSTKKDLSNLKPGMSRTFTFVKKPKNTGKYSVYARVFRNLNGVHIYAEDLTSFAIQPRFSAYIIDLEITPKNSGNNNLVINMKNTGTETLNKQVKLVVSSDDKRYYRTKSLKGIKPGCIKGFVFTIKKETPEKTYLAEVYENNYLSDSVIVTTADWEILEDYPDTEPPMMEHFPDIQPENPLDQTNRPQLA